MHEERARLVNTFSSFCRRFDFKCRNSIFLCFQAKTVEELTLRVEERQEELEQIRTMFVNKQTELDACIKLFKETKVNAKLVSLNARRS